MSDVLLICPNALDVEIHPIFDEIEPLLLSLSKKRNIVGLAAGAFVPPAELLSIASYLIKEGISVSILDLTLEALKGNNPNEILIKKLKKEDPKIVGVRACEICFINQYNDIANCIRNYNPDIMLVAGGVAATGYYEEFLTDLRYDVIVSGEGELTFLELCTLIIKEENFFKIHGIIYYNNDKCNFTPDRELMNLDLLLLPSRDIYPLDEMYKINGGIDLVYSSRGCPNNCSFCNAPMFWNRKWRGRRPEDVIKELKLIEEQGAKIVHIHDLNFGVNKKWFEKICTLVRENKLEVLWDCQITVSDLNKNTLKTLYAGNCRGSFIGIESASQTSLDGTNKNYSNSILLKGLQNAKKQGIHIDGGYVVGLPDDTITTLKDTKKLAINLLENDLVETPIYFLFNPWKGSYIGNNPTKFGIKIENNDLKYWHGFSAKLIASTKFVDAKTVYDFWESGWFAIRDILEEKVK